MAEERSGSKLGFLDSLTRIFRAKPGEAPAAAPREAKGFEALQASFTAALGDLDAKAEECRRRAQQGASAVASGASTKEARAAAELRQIETARREMREDVARMHARLKTGLENADLEALSEYLEELARSADAGKDSHELLPRARFAIAERLRKEAGELAAARLVALLQREKLGWPDPTQHRPSDPPERIETSRRRRLAETRELFLGQSLARTAERLLGVVAVWGPDYPDRGGPLWEETALEGVAAGLRGQLVKEAVELLQRDREALLASAEAAIGKELDALHQVLKAGVSSLEQANQAVASSLRVLDEVVPQIAWERVRAELPKARGEWGS